MYSAIVDISIEIQTRARGEILTSSNSTTDTHILPLPGHDGFDLREWPFYWLTQAYGNYIANLEATLKEIELDVPRWRVLMLLEGGDARSMSYLATEAITKLSTMTKIIQRMQDDKLVETRQRATDQRVTEIVLTGNGRRARVLARQQAEQIYARAFRDLSAEDLQHLNQLLTKLHTNLS